MKTKEEMIKQYNEYLNTIIKSNKPEDMKVLGEAMSWMFGQVVDKMPDVADSVLSHLAQVNWNNYLSEREMLNISKRMENQDGTKGFHWSYEVLKKALLELGGKIEEYPYYNCYALATVMNMIYSDHANSIALDLGFKDAKDVPNGSMALSCYRKAVEKLKDKDRKNFVRKYFANQMYDNSPM